MEPVSWVFSYLDEAERIRQVFHRITDLLTDLGLLVLDLVQDLGDLVVNRATFLDVAVDLFAGIHNGGVISVTKQLTNLRKRQLSLLTNDVHRDLSGHRDRLLSRTPVNLIRTDVVVVGYHFDDVDWGVDAGFANRNDIFQDGLH